MTDELTDILADLNSIRSLDTDLQTKIKKAGTLRDSVQAKVDRLEEEYSELKESGTGDSSIDTALETTVNKANMILLEKMEEAIVRNQEFSAGPFLDRLTAVCLNPDSIAITPVGDNDVFVEILLDETAGSLADYADGIEAVRGDLNAEKRVETSRSMASHFWREKFYAPAREGGKVTRRKWNRETKSYDEIDKTDEQRAKYWTTIDARLVASGKLAPFWEILDQGTTPLASDDDGTTPYPRNSRTNFTGKAVQAIRNFFKDQLKGIKTGTKGSLTKIREAIDSIEEGLTSIDDQIEMWEDEDMEFIDVVAERLGDELEDMDKSKIPETEKLIQKYRESRQTRFRIGGGKRVRVATWIAHKAAALGNE
jgi:hypothetical protein